MGEAVGIAVHTKQVFRETERVVESAKNIGMSNVDDLKAWAGAASDLSDSRLAKEISESKKIVSGTAVQKVSPEVINSIPIYASV